jgi:hypothetical protein
LEDNKQKEFLKRLERCSTDIEMINFVRNSKAFLLCRNLADDNFKLEIEKVFENKGLRKQFNKF